MASRQRNPVRTSGSNISPRRGARTRPWGARTRPWGPVGASAARRNAVATRTASAVSATSCVRMSAAPLCTAIAVAASEPASRCSGSGRPVSCPMNDFRETPTHRGRPRSRSAPSPAITAQSQSYQGQGSSRKNPIPGSSTMRSSGMPAARATARLCASARPTPATGEIVAVASSPAGLAIRIRPAARSRASEAIEVSPRSPVTSFRIVAPASNDRGPGGDHGVRDAHEIISPMDRPGIEGLGTDVERPDKHDGNPIAGRNVTEHGTNGTCNHAPRYHPAPPSSGPGRVRPPFERRLRRAQPCLFLGEASEGAVEAPSEHQAGAGAPKGVPVRRIRAISSPSSDSRSSSARARAWSFSRFSSTMSRAL